MGAGVRDAFPPPMCCGGGLFTRFVWVDCARTVGFIIECINELLKNKANLVHSQHRSIHNFIMNLCSALTAYYFFDNKPEALPVYVEKSKQVGLFAY